MQSREPGKAQTLDPGSSPDTILEQLNRILSHPEFQATPQQRDILRFVVTETLEGREHQIKGYTVATQVLGRKPDFDPKSDPAVSVQANRLRKALERYSLVAGSNDPIRIEIPKGTYVPVFHYKRRPVRMQPPGPGKPEASAERDPWPTVLVRPFRNLTGDPEQDYVSQVWPPNSLSN